MAPGYKKQPTFRDFQALAALLLSEHGLKAEAHISYGGHYLVQVGAPTDAIIWSVEEDSVWRYVVSPEGGRYLSEYGIKSSPSASEKRLVLDI